VEVKLDERVVFTVSPIRSILTLASYSERYETFDLVTRKSLIHAAVEAGVTLKDDAVSAIMAAYHQLPRKEV
jgi:hypothetical protein